MKDLVSINASIRRENAVTVDTSLFLKFEHKKKTPQKWQNKNKIQKRIKKGVSRDDKGHSGILKKYIRMF